MTTALKLKKEHVREEWSEGNPKNGGDGYWISLNAGWCNANDPREPLHCIHEDTKTQAWKVRVVPCNCTDCLSER